MPKIDPLPDMTEEEARAFRYSFSNEMMNFPGISKILSGYIDRHRADLAPSPTVPILPEMSDKERLAFSLAHAVKPEEIGDAAVARDLAGYLDR